MLASGSNLTFWQLFSPVLSFFSILAADMKNVNSYMFVTVANLVLFIALIILRNGMSDTDIRPTRISNMRYPNNTKIFPTSPWRKLKFGMFGW